jgi:hypothetical protein
MKTKTIEKILRGKFASFLKSIKDEDVRKYVKNNTIITGGAIVSLLLDEDPNDFDLYFTNVDTVLRVAKYYQDIVDKDKEMQNFIIIKEEENNVVVRVKLKIASTGMSSGVKKTQKKYYPIVITDNAITLSDKIQMIIRFWGNPEEIHYNFDFEHVKSYWLSSDGKLYLNPNSLEYILSKQLRYTGSLYPIASLFRLRKFLTKGWTISAGDIFKIAFQVNKLDLKNPQVLYDQLIGVDIYYFNELIAKIKRDLDEKNITLDDIDNTYISKVVDEIFHESDEYDIYESNETD